MTMEYPGVQLPIPWIYGVNEARPQTGTVLPAACIAELNMCNL